MQRVAALWGIGIVLAACGADVASSSQSAIAQNFDELATSIRNCAATLGQCSGDKKALSSGRCRNQFLSCRSSAGKPAEEDLAAAVGDCRERSSECPDDLDALTCDQALHECIGEAPPTEVRQERYRGVPNAHAPTYQCFGMLRECVASMPAPRECAAQARTCVISSVGDPPAPP
jgi:hypothetical protein